MNNKQILVVDDEAAIRNLLKMALSRVGYNVHTAGGAKEALKILEKNQIMVILIDLGLETMNGFDLCERIRKNNPKVIIYALTGNAGLYEQQKFKEACFNEYFMKPIAIEDLYKIIGNSFQWIERLAKR